MTQPDALATATRCIRMGWAPLPIPHKTKKPLIENWPDLRITDADVSRYFNGRPQNVGVILGPPSGGLCDVDLDCVEAVRLAPRLLPRTRAVFGRKSKRASHWIYVTDLAETADKAVLRFADPTTKQMLVELRLGGLSGAQTVFPGSTHESGEPIEWEPGQDGIPDKVAGASLRLRVAAIAAGALLARHWPGDGARHEFGLVLGGFLARAGWTPDDVASFVEAVAGVAGDPDPIDRINAAKGAAEAHRAGKKAYGLKTLRGALGAPVADRIAEWLGYRESVEAEPESPKPAGNDIVTEDGAALLFADRYRDRLRYCHDTGGWFEWAGTIWSQNKTGLAFQFARELARKLSDSEAPKVRYITSKVSFAGGVEKFARHDPAFAVTMDHWDRDPWLLGTPGGTVDLRSGVMRAGLPAEGITKSTAVAPGETADCPLWLRFLDEATGSDGELIRFLQQWCGYALTGVTREHALVFVYGPGGNGKSVFLNVLTGILNAYATPAAMDAFTASKGDKHPTDLASLRGARLVTASETEEGRAWAEARIKQITGGDPISARFMRQDFFTFLPTFKLTIVGNHQPVLRNVDDAAKRRFNIVPFTRKPAQPDRQLEEKLKAEWPGILRWMIEGCLDWQRSGLVRPSSVTAATDRYFEEQDLFGQWLGEECEIEPGNDHKWETTTDLFASWSAYAKAAGDEPGTAKSFAPAMRRNGLREYRSKHARGWKGIRLNAKAEGDYRSRRDPEGFG